MGPGATVSVDIAFTSADGDIDMELQDSSGSPLVTSNGSGGTESVTWTNTGNFFEVVYARNFLFQGGDPGDCVSYEMTYDITDPPGCTDDMFEDDDSSPDATYIDVNFPFSESYDLVANDADWFFLNSTFIELHDITITYDPTSDVFIEMYDTDTFAFIAGSYSGSVTDTVSPGAGQDVLIRVVPNGATCEPYTIEFDSF